MIDSGLILMLNGALALATVPAEQILAGRRWVRTEMIEPALRQAFPLPPAPDDLTPLATGSRLPKEDIDETDRRLAPSLAPLVRSAARPDQRQHRSREPSGR